jgi:23S rRNA-/tRNA-specific pseudouridylate synthase
MAITLLVVVSLSLAGERHAGGRSNAVNPHRSSGGAARLAHPDYAVIEDVTIGLAETPGLRLPGALRQQWPQRFATDSAAKKALRRKLVIVDEDACGSVSDAILPGQRLRLLARVAPGPAPGEGRRGKLPDGAQPLDCVYEDDYLAVVYKPPGLSVQGEVRTRLALGLMPTRIRGHEGNDQPLWRPQHVHRLDAPTCGLLVCAKTGHALRSLSASFAARHVHKRYRALLSGHLAVSRGTITEPLSGQPARTDWRVVARYEGACGTSGKKSKTTLVDFFPVTGRTHQLRRHALMLGHPIVGDTRYGRDASDDGGDASDDGGDASDDGGDASDGGGDASDGAGQDREQRRGLADDALARGLMLSAQQIDFPHPKHGELLVVRAREPSPARFEAYLSGMLRVDAPAPVRSWYDQGQRLT